MGSNTVIKNVSHIIPENIIPSSEIENRLEHTLKKLNFPKGLIAGLTGIKERRIWDKGISTCQAATMAARKAIEESGIDISEIDCLINTSVCKDYIEPSVASIVHGSLGLNQTCRNFDICNACLGFMDGINVMSMMIEAGLVRCGIIVDAESSAEPLFSTIKFLNRPEVTAEDLHSNFATLTLGSGAAAMILCHKNLCNEGHRINGSVSMASTSHSMLCLGQKDRMTADAPKVLKYGVLLAHKVWKKAETSLADWNDRDIDIYIPHQVSARNTSVLCQTLGISKNKFHLNFQELGNIGPAAIPITLSMAHKSGKLKKGNHAALLGIGSGLNCTMMSITW